MFKDPVTVARYIYRLAGRPVRQVYSKRTVKVQAVDRFDRSDDITGQPLINGDIGSPYLRQPEVFRSDINLAGDFCLYGCRIGTVKVHITFEEIGRASCRERV